MRAGSRKTLMAFLVTAFVIQTSLVYTDNTSEATPPLTEEAMRGRALWHKHNCQTCHQLYGFGGFLGPDLTNAAPRLTLERVDEILTVGSGQMPAFGFEEDEIDEILAFLTAVDATGVGQARRYAADLEPAAVEAALDEHSTEGTLTGTAAHGRQVFRANCTSCHRLFQATPLGPFMAPDLTDVTARLNSEELRDVIAKGRPERGMVPPELSDADRESVADFLGWLGANRPTLAERLGIVTSSQSLPWFEFK